MQSKLDKLIQNKLRKQGEFTIKELSAELGISRQAIHKHVKNFLNHGTIKKIGSTRGTKYVKTDRSDTTTHQLRRTYQTKELHEDEVLESVKIALDLRHQMNTNAREIFSYAFTEILNNAIEHSQSERVLIHIELKTYTISCTIRDYGVGIFAHMQDRLGLPSEEVSLQELIKGKATTDPERHTGEGLFFTSRSTDLLQITSHRLSLIFDNKVKDIFTSIHRFLKGTDVDFSISRNTKRNLTDSFNEFAGMEYDYTFSKTSVKVKLFARDRERFLSRSIAKRIVHRLEQFEEIIIDFTNVPMIGQGFADQIFRVFPQQHPHVKIIPKNANRAINTMIRHVLSES